MNGRDQFEAALASMLLENHPLSGVTPDEIKQHRSGDEYESTTFSAAWWAWQASRETLVIELPKGDSLGAVPLISRSDAVEAIEATGLTVAP